MRKSPRWQLVTLSVFAMALLGACQNTDLINLHGRLLDGVTGKPITAYNVSLTIGGSVVKGTVKDGVYTVGPILPWQDFSISFDATGYRPFYSNLAFNPTVNLGSNSRTFELYREATVFPTNLQTPPTTIRVFLSDNAAGPQGGTLRLTPVAAGTSILLFDPTAAPNSVNPPSAAGFPPQTLPNHADRETLALTQDITAGGTVSFAAGALTYGVQYDAMVYGVPGYNIAGNLTGGAGSQRIIAGNLDTFAITLQPFNQSGNPAFAVVFDSSQNEAATLQPDGSLTLVFNQPIELDPEILPAQYIENLYGHNGDPNNQAFLFDMLNTMTNAVQTNINIGTLANGNAMCPSTGVTNPPAPCMTANMPINVGTSGPPTSTLNPHGIGTNGYGFAITLDGTPVGAGVSGSVLKFAWNQGGAFASLVGTDKVTAVHWRVGYIKARNKGSLALATAIGGGTRNVKTLVPPVN